MNGNNGVIIQRDTRVQPLATTVRSMNGRRYIVRRSVGGIYEERKEVKERKKEEFLRLLWLQQIQDV
jgi:uncharacterized protein YlzI (FlbEa/FlbD family)